MFFSNLGKYSPIETGNISFVVESSFLSKNDEHFFEPEKKDISGNTGPVQLDVVSFLCRISIPGYYLCTIQTGLLVLKACFYAVSFNNSKHYYHYH